MKKVAVLLSLIVLSSCATYRPVVDNQSISDDSKYNRDIAECRDITTQNTNTFKSIAKDTLIAGAIGTGAGALFGVTAGNTAKGLATGAVIGGLAGGTKGAYDSDNEYRTIYRNCMRGRGYNVLN